MSTTPNPWTRRQFLNTAAVAGSGLLTGTPLFGRAPPPPTYNKKLAAITTTYHRYSHADDIITKVIEGYSIVDKNYPPPCKVASLYIDQIGDDDIGRGLMKYWDIPIVKSIAETLTLGGNELAVDGVLLIAEQGDYPNNEKGQKLYPRRKFFEEILKVFRASKRSVPVYLDKHFSYSWDDAKWMYDQSKELGFPMMAGSSVPVARRIPNVQPKIGVEWDRVLSVGHGHFEAYGFHTLEALQVMAERRKGGETGVRAVQCLAGKDAWDAAEKGAWDRKLLDEAVSKMPGKNPKTIDENDKDALVYLIDYMDGFQAAAYMSPRHVKEFAFGGRIKGEKDPVAWYFELPKPQRDHFSYLVTHIGKMMGTGKATYPVERTLLTTGMLAALMESRADGNKRFETPHLKVAYQPVEL